jgi:hypothetical protein
VGPKIALLFLNYIPWLPTKKKTETFSAFWRNFLVSVNLHRIYKLCSYQNFTEKIAEALPASSTKKYVWKNLSV